MKKNIDIHLSNWTNNNNSGYEDHKEGLWIIFI